MMREERVREERVREERVREKRRKLKERREIKIYKRGRRETCWASLVTRANDWQRLTCIGQDFASCMSYGPIYTSTCMQRQITTPYIGQPATCLHKFNCTSETSPDWLPALDFRVRMGSLCLGRLSLGSVYILVLMSLKNKKSPHNNILPWWNYIPK